MPTATEYRQRVAQYLNVFPMTTVTADPSTQAAGGKPGFPDGKIDRAVIDASALIRSLIASNPTHPRRRDLVTATAATHGALLPSHVGPVGAVLVDGAPSAQTSVDDVIRLRTNALSLTHTTPYHAFDGERFFFSGTAATVDIVALTEPVDPAAIPAEYANAVIARALAMLFPFGGDPEKMGAAQHFDAIATRYEQMVAEGQTPPVVPEVV